MSPGLVNLLAYCGVALIVLAGVSFASGLKDRTRNIAVGIGSLVLAVLVVGYLSIKPMLTSASEAPQRFVAYFDNAGGIGRNDLVRMKGRPVGRVLSATVVKKDGRPQVRVEFEIAPGSGAQWLKHGGVPSDSVLRVRMPNLLGRPSLVIAAGDEDDVMASGSEWKRTESVKDESQFEGWLRAVKEFDAAIDKYMAFVSPEMIADLKRRVIELREMVENARTMAENTAAAAPDIARRIAELEKALAQLLEGMRKQSPDVTANVESLRARLEAAPKMAEDAIKFSADLRGQIARFDSAISAAGKQAEDGELSRVLRALRSLSATLRAGAVRAEYNPKQAGDMPPWRFSRPHYNGGKSALEMADAAEKGGARKYQELPPAPRPKPRPESED